MIPKNESSFKIVKILKFIREETIDNHKLSLVEVKAILPAWNKQCNLFALIFDSNSNSLEDLETAIDGPFTAVYSINYNIDDIFNQFKPNFKSNWFTPAGCNKGVLKSIKYEETK
jgi:hypothetical protein